MPGIASFAKRRVNDVVSTPRPAALHRGSPRSSRPAVARRGPAALAAARVTGSG